MVLLKEEMCGSCSRYRGLNFDLFYNLMSFFDFGQMASVSSIHQEIRMLCAKYGYRSVQEGIQSVIQQDYASLKELVEGISPGGGGFFVPVAAVPDASDVPQVLSQPGERKKKSVKKAKEKKEDEKKEEFAPAAEVFQDDLIDGLVGTVGCPLQGHPPAVPQLPSLRHSNIGAGGAGANIKVSLDSAVGGTTQLGTIKPGTEVVVSKLGASEEPEVRPTFYTVAEERAWQKEEEAKTKAKLDATGIAPDQLLTKENLQQWVQKEKKGYAYIARRHVGLPESAIAAKCKEFGIVSEAAKRRQAIVASRVNAARGRGRGR